MTKIQFKHLEEYNFEWSESNREIFHISNKYLLCLQALDWKSEEGKEFF